MPEETRHRDGCVITAAPFAELVREFVTRWNKERPQPGGQFGLSDEPPVQPLAWLAAESQRMVASAGIPDVVTKGVLEGLLERDADGVIELRVADAISAALDRPDVFYDERVEIRPNPRARRDAWRECCAGSDQAA